MSYDPDLAYRLFEILNHHPHMEEKKMFGGIVWFLNGNMCVGVYKEWLIARVGLDSAAELLNKNSHIKPMDFTGRVMKGWIMVSPEGMLDTPSLQYYLKHAIEFVNTLPEK